MEQGPACGTVQGRPASHTQWLGQQAYPQSSRFAALPAGGPSRLCRPCSSRGSRCRGSSQQLRSNMALKQHVQRLQQAGLRGLHLH